jgi:hypothetical protein
VTHSPYARAPDLTVTLSRIAVQFLTLIFPQHTEVKDVITSKTLIVHLVGFIAKKFVTMHGQMNVK